ncbi:MAG: hypothetical protein AABX13_04290 [Nanoarchaeota archaeon]
MKVTDIIIVVLFVVTLITVFWYLFGNSPTLEQGLLILILTFMFTIYGNVREQGSRLELIEKSFLKLVDDFKEHVKHK